MKTHICMLLDRSGSMEKVKEETITGFNNFVKEQQLGLKKVVNGCDCKKCGCSNSITMTLIQFDDEFNVNFAKSDINMVSPLEYKPRGMTKLMDSIDFGIRQTAKDIDRDTDKVLFVIMTDGQDNASVNKLSDIAKTIRHYENEHKWQFVFIGTNMDAFTESSKIGIPYNWTYSTTYCSVPDMWNKFSKSAVVYVSSNTKQVDNFFGKEK